MRPFIPHLAPRRRKGATLFEILLVLLAIAGIIAGATIAFSQTGTRQRLNEAQTQINMLISGIRQYFAGFGTYAGLTNGVAVNAGIVPRHMIPNPPAAGAAAPPNIPLRHPWAGSVSLAPATVVTANDAFSITFSGLSNEACRNLLTINTSAAPGSIISIQANATTVFNEGGTQLTVNGVNAACTQNNNNTIVWTVR